MTDEPRTIRTVVVRMPPDLHAALMRAARASKVSLNTYCVAVFARATRVKRKGVVV